MSAKSANWLRVCAVFLTILQVMIVVAKVCYLGSSAGSVAFGFLMLVITSGAAWVTFNQTRRWYR